MQATESATSSSMPTICKTDCRDFWPASEREHRMPSTFTCTLRPPRIALCFCATGKAQCAPCVKHPAVISVPWLSPLVQCASSGGLQGGTFITSHCKSRIAPSLASPRRHSSDVQLDALASCVATRQLSVNTEPSPQVNFCPAPCGLGKATPHAVPAPARPAQRLLCIGLFVVSGALARRSASSGVPVYVRDSLRAGACDREGPPDVAVHKRSATIACGCFAYLR
ncbi:hypothetical protein PsYK624_152380 [Phanerochaete sordida]|uniref:Uncharacterized protein n=1 Tax=Phanerochaete sordida TaxID=48140 RepID=A0A9P3GSY6_9APHY|nr:hypothetical protein PsYK624_152380 [Phanerochaete sordida]